MIIKSWLIKASAPICGVDKYYCAFSDIDPLEQGDFPYDEITDNLWNDYSYLLHLEDEEYESEEKAQEAYDEVYDDWQYNCGFSSKEMSLKELQDYILGGAKSEDDLPDIIYDMR